MADNGKKPLPKFWETIESHLRGLAAAIGALVALLGAGYGLYTWFNDHFEARRHVPPPIAEPESSSNNTAPVSNTVSPPPKSDHVPTAADPVTAASLANEAASQAAAQASAAQAPYDPARPKTLLERGAFELQKK